MNWRLLSNYVIAFGIGSLVTMSVARVRPEWFNYKQRRIEMAKSKVIQIAAHNGDNGEPDSLYALTENGEIWFGEWGMGKEDIEFRWKQKIPQPGEE